MKIVIRFRLSWDAEQLPTKLFDLVFFSVDSYEENKSNLKNKNNQVSSKTIWIVVFYRNFFFFDVRSTIA